MHYTPRVRWGRVVIIVTMFYTIIRLVSCVFKKRAN